MATKKVSYKNLLKEAISEFDTSKTVEVKGPMLDPVLSWDGGGEIPTHKDAASILERYYFNEDQDESVEIEEGEYNDDGKPDSGASMKNAKGAGTEQAGTSDGAMDKREEEIAKEQEEVAVEQDEKKDEKEEEKAAEAAPEEEEKVKEDEDVTEDIENAVIEKLIAEMEEEDEEEKPEEGAEEEVKEDAEVAAELDMTYTGEGPKPGMEAPKEKKQKDTEQDAHGVGTQQAGTGVDAGQVPDRKDMADTFVKPAKVAQEGEEVKEQDAAVKPEEDEEELDVDKEVTKEDGLPSDPIHGHTHGAPLGIKSGGVSQDDDEVEESLEQAFKIFSEAIEDESE